ncbi:MAG TPA: molybdopterin molybdenumtransferase MoeA, partial [Casimicrobium sp.]|nr:molybdopterin molybdenumtransferase MoeA [Casimicrobium sp.]
TIGPNGCEVKTTGDQGSGILSSMTQANCFVVLGTDVGNVAAGAVVDVQMFEGVV